MEAPKLPDLGNMKLPELPKMGNKGRERSDPVVSRVREAGCSPIPSLPHIMKKAPHQDASELVSDLVGICQEAGATICGFLDKPLSAALKIEGPHRIIDDALTVPTGMTRSLVEVFQR
jgi:hypothetical protein